MNLRRLATRAKELQGRYGVGGLRYAWPHIWRRLRARRDYRRWMERHGVDVSDIEARVNALNSRPLISILLPVFNVDEKWLRRCIDSVIAQVYPDWELCIADDASTAPHIRPVLEQYAARDARVKLVFRTTNGHISAASNSALELATGEFIALLDHDDELSRDALFWVANEIDSCPEAAIIYSDEDLIDERGRRYAPKFKPDFGRDLFYSFNLVTHLSVFRADLVRSVEGFRIGFEGSQDYDLALRILELIDEKQIRHIPKVLYHWRTIPGSLAHSMDEKPYAHERARAAISEHFERTGVKAEVVETDLRLHQVVYLELYDLVTRVPVNPDGVVIEPGAKRDSTYGPHVQERGARSLNEAAAKSTSDVLFFFDADLELYDEQIFHHVGAAAMHSDIGAVGCSIVEKDGLIEQVGIVLSSHLSPALALNGLPRDVSDDMRRNRINGNAIATSISSLAIRRDLFNEMGGFDQEAFPSHLFDIDLCLRLWERGKRVMILPYLELVRHEGRRERSPASDVEAAEFRRRWRKYAARDPFCNPNLKRDGSFEIDV